MADFLDLFAADAEDFVRVELRDTVTGESLAKANGGKPPTVLCHSLNSKTGQRIARAEMSKEAMQHVAAITKGEVPTLDLNAECEELNAKAEALIAGFENMLVPDGDGGARHATIDDLPRFVASNAFSNMNVDHRNRKAIGRRCKRDEDGKPLIEKGEIVFAETEKQFNDRMAKWIGASFAQQIVDAVEAHADFLAKAKRG